jgi:hypothetical protein
MAFILGKDFLQRVRLKTRSRPIGRRKKGTVGNLDPRGTHTFRGGAEISDGRTNACERQVYVGHLISNVSERPALILVSES